MPGSAFSRSRWHYRGWTLPELLAPDEVMFYNAYWERIGTRSGLADIMSKITRIHVHALTADDKNEYHDSLEASSANSVLHSECHGRLNDKRPGKRILHTV